MSERTLPTPQDDTDRALLGHIERVGWAVLGIEPDAEGPAYAFSLGLYHTLGHPEIILMGLKHEVAQGLINDLGEAIRGGQRFEANRQYEGIAAGFPLALVAVGPQHYREYLGYARWLYHGSEFPVLQCIWPDKAGVFPWQPEYDGRFLEVQPLLGCWGWKGVWPFTDPPNRAVFTTRQVVREGEPILLVVHDAEDDNWQFHPGSSVKLKDAMIVSLHLLAERDPSLAELADLPPGWRARRPKPGAPWKRSRKRNGKA